MSETLVTIECSIPGDSYALIEHGPKGFDVHLAGPSRYGIGPCLCGFDRHARDENGRAVVGFSVGGGFTGPSFTHRVCAECKRLGAGRSISGTHAHLFEEADHA